MNRKKTEAALEGLAVKRRRGRKRARGTREPHQLPTGPSKRWSLDFIADTFGVSRRFRVLRWLRTPPSPAGVLRGSWTP